MCVCVWERERERERVRVREERERGGREEREGVSASEKFYLPKNASKLFSQFCNKRLEDDGRTERTKLIPKKIF